LQAIVSYAYLNTKVLSDTTSPINQGQHLADAPRNVFTLWNRYNITKKFGVGAGVRFQDKTRLGGTLAYYASVTSYDAALFYNANWAGRTYRFPAQCAQTSPIASTVPREKLPASSGPFQFQYKALRSSSKKPSRL